MAFYENQKTKYDIPLNHLDHNYIPGCKNVKELEKILKVLRSGEEGNYPELEKLTEEQIEKLDPNNKLLRKSGKPLKSGDLEEEERKEHNNYIDEWLNEAQAKEKQFANPVQNVSDELPPVRNTATMNSDKNTKEETDAKKSSKKQAKPRDYREWDRFDIDAELNKVEERNGSENTATTTKVNTSKSKLSESVDGSGLTEELKQTKADFERNKGNEAFKAGDFDEAIIYYNRSISVLPTAAAYNNRALVYLRQKKWNKALDDCCTVLEMEPENLKAMLRRASAYQGLTRYAQAKKDLEVVLSKEPNNKNALSILKEMSKTLEDQKVHGRRMNIEEIEESEPEKMMTEDSATVDNSADSETSETLPTEKTSQNDKDVETQKQEETATTSSKQTVFHIGSGEPEPVTRLPDEKIDLGSMSETSKGTTEVNEEVSPVPALPLGKNVLVLKDAGTKLFRCGQYGDALQKYDAAIKKIPAGDREKHAVDLSVLYSNRAACKMKIGDCRGCVEDCDEAVKLYPTAPKPYLRRAMAYEQMERFQDAFVDYKQAMNAGINSEVAQQGSDRCASVLQQMNGPGWRDKLPKIASFSSFAGLFPPSTSAAASTGVSSSSSSSSSSLPVASQKEDFEALFEKHKEEGNKLFAKGSYLEASDYFTKCIEIFPDRVVPFTNRALCFLKLCKYEEVLNDCNQALSIEFHNVKALYRRALAYKMQEKYEESLIDLETLLKLDPNNSAAKKELQVVTQCKEDMQEKKAQFACLREQQKLRHRMKIKEVDGSSDEEEEKKSPKQCPKVSPHPRSPAEVGTNTTQKRQAEASLSGGKSSAQVKLDKVTPYAFLQAWKSLKGPGDINSYAALLEQVQPQDLPKVISSSLDGDVIVKIVQCTKMFCKSGRVQQAFEYLQNLVLVPRFDMMLMFISEQDKSKIGKVFESLAEHSKDGIDLDLLAQTRNKYGV